MLALLPWLRHGHLPPSLCKALQARLSAREKAEARAIFAGMIGRQEALVDGRLPDEAVPVFLPDAGYPLSQIPAALAPEERRAEDEAAEDARIAWRAEVAVAAKDFARRRWRGAAATALGVGALCGLCGLIFWPDAAMAPGTGGALWPLLAFSIAAAIVMALLLTRRGREA
jgi:hypothetical protein